MGVVRFNLRRDETRLKDIRILDSVLIVLRLGDYLNGIVSLLFCSEQDLFPDCLYFTWR